MGLCQQQEETVGVEEQVNSEKPCRAVLRSPIDLEDMILKLHQKFLTGYNWKLGQSTFSLSVVLGGVTKLGIVSRD